MTMPIADATPLWAQLEEPFASRVKKLEQFAHDVSRLTLEGTPDDRGLLFVSPETVQWIIDRAKEVVGA